MLDLDVWRTQYFGEFGRHVRVLARFLDRVEHLEREHGREIERSRFGPLVSSLHHAPKAVESVLVSTVGLDSHYILLNHSLHITSLSSTCGVSHWRIVGSCCWLSVGSERGQTIDQASLHIGWAV